MDSFLLILILFFIVSIAHFFKNNDEIPAFVILFSLLCYLRLRALESGKAEWAEFDYGLYFIFDLEHAYIAWHYIAIGTLTLVLAYFFFFKENKKPKIDTLDSFKTFLRKKEEFFFIGGAIFYVFKLFAGSSLSVGYSFLLGLASNSFIIFLFLLYFNSNLNLWKRIFFGIFLSLIAYSTYDPVTRFFFLGWSVPVVVYLFRNYHAIKKSVFYIVGLVIISIVFSIGGLMRNYENWNKSTAQLVDEGLETFLLGHDINFIDGFVMLHQVYPRHLDFHLGTDHLGILVRPIPRSLWSGKPEGAWQQKYAAKHNLEKFVTGISPTIYGVFYGEGGVIAIIIFSILYGYIFVRIKLYWERYSESIQYLIKGVFFAALIPLFRSGDLPGDISIICMSYWPIFLFIYQYNKYLDKLEQLSVYEEILIK
ncbi:MAG TPA: O-antigen polymerase [Cytophagaceae bacterium]|jgi:oligosaccharide repeat unit polymerase